jgi:hypothetical protein
MSKKVLIPYLGTFFWRFLTSLIFVFTISKISNSGEIISVERGLILPVIEIKYMDKDGDIAECEVFKNNKRFGKQETFIIVGLAEFKFDINIADIIWRTEGNYYVKQKFKIECKTTKFIETSNSLAGPVSRFISYPKKLIKKK